ncbi:MAG: 1-acyl-sn-glycerol-3-phosphate acyltransferase [Bacteroidota bacterium]
MIIKPKLLPTFLTRISFYFLNWFLRKRFNKLLIHKVPIKPDHSYLLMCNHFSFWDGMWATYLSGHALNTEGQKNKLYIMVLKKQMQMNPWLKYFGCFSVSPGTHSVSESISYAAELLNTPGNVVLMYPQGNLESSHVRHIVMKEGIEEIVNRVQGNCQLLWSSNLTEYFESLRPSIHFHMLDCGTAKDFDFVKLGQNINAHHKAAVQKQFRFTEESSDS